MIKKNKPLLIGIITAIVILAAIVVWQIVDRSGYYALYLSTGDIYFGKLVWFSRYTLKDPYYLRITQEEEAPISIERFQDAFWVPGKTLKFSPKNVIWISKLDPTSPVISYIESQAKGGTIPSGE